MCCKGASPGVFIIGRLRTDLAFLFLPSATPSPLINPKGNQGWLQFAAEREDYYGANKLPPQMIFDFNSDYIPPPALSAALRARTERGDEAVCGSMESALPRTAQPADQASAHSICRGGRYSG